jgi:REP element-mobilizing transposase RayT
MAKGVEQGLPFRGRNWGGKRKGAGRKPKGKFAGVSHRTREKLAKRFPVLVTIRLRKNLPTLHKGPEFGAILEALAAGHDRFGFRVVHYSVQTNHLHLLVEAKDRTALSRGMQGLLIRIAKRLNKLWKRTGSIFSDRYHDRILRTPREVRNALVYVLQNTLKHGKMFLRAVRHAGRTRNVQIADPYTSAAFFDGWRAPPPLTDNPVAIPVAAPHTWLLRIGWRRHGLLRLTDVPRL